MSIGLLCTVHIHIHVDTLYTPRQISTLILNHDQTPPMHNANMRSPAQDMSMSCDCAGSEIVIKISSYSSSLNEALCADCAEYGC